MSIWLAFIIALLLFLIVIVSEFYITHKNRYKQSISFKESLDLTELPIVTFYYDDVKRIKLNFLLDTGSNLSHINKSVLSSINENYEEKESVSVIGINGSPMKSSICNLDIKYKDLSFTEEFVVSDLDTVFSEVKKNTGVQIHGILGSKFFEKYKYIIDFKELIAHISK